MITSRRYILNQLIIIILCKQQSWVKCMDGLYTKIFETIYHSAIFSHTNYRG